MLWKRPKLKPKSFQRGHLILAEMAKVRLGMEKGAPDANIAAATENYVRVINRNLELEGHHLKILP